MLGLAAISILAFSYSRLPHRGELFTTYRTDEHIRRPGNLTSAREIYQRMLYACERPNFKVQQPSITTARPRIILDVGELHVRFGMGYDEGECLRKVVPPTSRASCKIRRPTTTRTRLARRLAGLQNAFLPRRIGSVIDTSSL